MLLNAGLYFLQEQSKTFISLNTREHLSTDIQSKRSQYKSRNNKLMFSYFDSISIQESVQTECRALKVQNDLKCEIKKEIKLQVSTQERKTKIFIDSWQVEAACGWCGCRSVYSAA